MGAIPLLLLSDSVDTKSGLGRITRDLAVHFSQMPEFRVASLGRGGRATSRLPWMQYVMGDGDWGESYIEEVWNDFAGNERGVVMSIYDPVRVRYLVDRRGLGDARLVKFLDSGRFERWLYATIDATGPNNKLTGIVADTILKFDRVIAYGLWAQELIVRSTGRTDVDWLPHGVNFKAFQPRDKVGAKLAMGVGNDETVIGCVMSNQTRKDWGTAFVVFDQLRRQRPNMKFWVHVDEPIRHWNLTALAQDYGVGEQMIMTQAGMYSDAELSWLYSACDLTILPSSEGFGYPIVESMACGVPVVHSTYGGGAELVPMDEWKVEPKEYRMEGIYNCLRPVWGPQDWVNAVLGMLEREPWPAEECRRVVEHLNWKVLGKEWQRWAREGIGAPQVMEQAGVAAAGQAAGAGVAGGLI